LAFYGILKSKNKVQFYTVVGIACIIGLSHIWTEHLLFQNSLIGLDPWTHQVRTIGQPFWKGIGGSYSLMHIYLKSAMGLFDINYKWASLIFVGSLQTVGIVLFTFLLGRMLWNAKVGCIAGLMVVSANWVIFFGEWIIPNAMGAVYSLMMVYLIIKISRGSTKWLLTPMGLLILVAYATSFMAIVWVLGTLTCLWLVPTLFGTLSVKAKIIKVMRLSAVPLLGVGMLMLLLNVTALGGSIQKVVGDDMFAPNYGVTHAVGRVPTPSEVPTQNEVPIPSKVPTQNEVMIPGQLSERGGQPVFEQEGGVLGELAIGSMGMFLYISLAVIGCLIMLRRNSIPIQKTFVVLSLAILSIGFFPSLFGFSVIEHRWWYLAEVFLVVPLGIALVSLASTRYQWVISILVVVIVFLSTIGLTSNMTNRTLSPNLIARYVFTEGEMESLTVVQEYNLQVVGTDPMFSPLVNANLNNVKVISLTDEILSCDFRSQRADILLLRDALHKEPFGYGAGTLYKLEYDLVEVAKQQGYREVWRNGEVTCLIKE